MTKKWSSTASMDGKTKRQASKEERREAKQMAKIAEEYNLDPLADFVEHLCSNQERLGEPFESILSKVPYEK